MQSTQVPDTRVSVIHFPYVLWHYRLPTYRELSRRLDGRLEVVYCEVERDLAKRDEWKTGCNFAIRRYWGRQLFNWRILLWAAPLIGCIGKPNVVLLEWNLRNIFLVPATIALRIFRKRVVWWGHGVPKEEKPFLRKLHYNLGRICPNAVLVYMESARSALIQREGFNHSKVFVAPNSLDTRAFDDAIETLDGSPALFEKIVSSYQISLGKKYFIYSGRLNRGRDLERILIALNTVIARGFKSGAIFIGDGEARDDLVALAKNLKLEDEVHFTGTVYEPLHLAALYKASFASVIPGWLGLTLTQASSMGIPSVICDEPSLHNPEIAVFKEAVTGLKYNYSENNLGETLIKLLEQPSLARQMGESAKKRIASEFSTEKMVDGILNACNLS